VIGPRKTGAKKGCADIAFGIRDSGAHASAIFVIDDMGQFDGCPLHPLRKKIAGKRGKPAFFGTAAVGLSGIDPVNTDTNGDAFPQPNEGLDLNRVAVDDPFNFGSDRPLDRVDAWRRNRHW